MLNTMTACTTVPDGPTFERATGAEESMAMLSASPISATDCTLPEPSLKLSVLPLRNEVHSWTC